MHTVFPLDPVDGRELKVAISHMARVPETLLKHIRFGVFLNITTCIKFQLDYQGTCDTEFDADRFKKCSFIVRGGLELELALEAYRLSESIISGNLAGKTGITAECSGIY